MNYISNSKDGKARFLETSGVKSIGSDEKEGGIVIAPGWMNGWFCELGWVSSGWSRGFESVVGWGWRLSGCGFALECIRCLLDIQINLASGNKGLQLKRGFRDIGFYVEMVFQAKGMTVHPQRNGMKQEKGWCKRNPGKKEFREVRRVVIRAGAPRGQLR